jgi:serine/threonine-protein kinase
MALRDRLRGDLDAIVLKALRPEPERRYASVEAFRTDVLRYLKGLPVLAKADTLRYRLAKFVRRQRTLVASASVVLVALIAATLISVRSARSASAEAGRARRMVTFLQTVVGAGDASFYSVMRGSKDITLRELLDSTAARVPESFRDDPRTRADLYSALARSMRRFNRYELTLALLDSALALHEATVGALSNEVATDLTMKSFIDTDLSRETEAVALLRRALGIFRAVRSPSMADFTVTQTAMGELYLLTLGQPDSGLAMLRPALARELASASARPQLVGKIHQLIGVALSVKGDTIGGDSAFARSVRTLSADSLRESEQLSYALVNWGAIYSRRRRFADAIERTRHALRLIETAYGPTHLRTATVQSRLADEYMQLGMFTAARPVIDSALTAFRSLPTRNASEIADALRVRARVQLLAHEYAAASQSIAEARRILPELEEDRAEHDLDLQWVEARILEATGDTAAEHRVLQASVAFTRKHFGQDTERMRVALGKLLRFDSLQATKPH